MPILLVVLAWGSLDSWLTELTRPGSQPTPTPCPGTVASWLPDDGTDSVLVGSYTTQLSQVHVCRTSSGQLYYDGQTTGAVADNKTHICLPATETPTGYVARNKSHTYEITGSSLVVTNRGKLVKRWTLTRTGP